MSLKFLHGLCASLLCWQSSFAIAELRATNIDEMMALPEVVERLDPAVKLSWGDKGMPDMAERAIEERFSEHSRTKFGNRCTKAFAGVIASAVSQAKEQGYDQAWLQGHPYKDGRKPVMGKFFCDDGFLYAAVELSVTLGVSKVEQARQQAALNDPERKAAIAAQVVQRKALGKTVFLPLASLLESREAKQMLRPNEQLFWGDKPLPAFSLRKGPAHHSDEASYKEFGADKACHAAGLKVLEEILKDMREYGFNAAVRIHSKLNDLPALDDEYECQLGKSSADVSLYATLARLD